MRDISIHTTIGLKKATKKRLDGMRAPGQCYDGFLCQMMDIWEANESASRPRKKYKRLTEEVPA